VDTHIAEAIESAYRMEREHGFLRLDAMRMDATFTAIERLAETQDLSVLDGCPDWLLEDLRAWVLHFKKLVSSDLSPILGHLITPSLWRAWRISLKMQSNFSLHRACASYAGWSAEFKR